MAKVVLSMDIGSGQLAALVEELQKLGIVVTMRLQPAEDEGAKANADVDAAEEQTEESTATARAEEPEDAARGMPRRRRCAMCELFFVATSDKRMYCDSCRRVRAKACATRRKERKGGKSDDAGSDG